MYSPAWREPPHYDSIHRSELTTEKQIYVKEVDAGLAVNKNGSGSKDLIKWITPTITLMQRNNGKSAANTSGVRSFIKQARQLAEIADHEVIQV